jgi:hypothetical protein
MTPPCFLAGRGKDENYFDATLKFLLHTFFIVSHCDIKQILRRTNHMMK